MTVYPTVPSEMKTLALLGAWHNSLDRMPAVILCISSVKYYYFYLATFRNVKKGNIFLYLEQKKSNELTILRLF